MPEGNPEQYLREALELVRMAAADPALDDIDTESVEKVTTLLQSILAQGQKDELDMAQGKVNPRAMAKMMGRSAPSSAGGGLNGPPAEY